MKKRLKHLMWYCGFARVNPGFHSPAEISNILMRRLVTIATIALLLCFGLWIVCLIHLL